jgi:Polyketide cyclase / dehydrase and lipid transport
MLKILGIVLAVVVLAAGALVAYAATRPDDFRVERSIVVKAAPDKIFPLLNDMHRFNEWNPFDRKDPGKGQYSGAPNGVGAAYKWDSSTLGAGSMTISETVPNERVTMKLDFLKPMEANNLADFTLRPKDGGTEVTWAMYGPAPLLTKIMDVVIGMDKMVGGDFEQGLVNLKTIAEK